MRRGKIGLRSKLGGHIAGHGMVEDEDKYEDIAPYRPKRTNTVRGSQGWIIYTEETPGIRLPTNKDDYDKMSGEVKTYKIGEGESNERCRKSRRR